MNPLRFDRSHLSFTPDMADLKSDWYTHEQLRQLPFVSIGDATHENIPNETEAKVYALICHATDPCCLICTLTMCSKHPRT